MLIESRQRLSTFYCTSLPDNRRGSYKSGLPYQITWGAYRPKLDLECHINKIAKKIASRIGALKRVRPFVPGTSLQFIFNSLVQLHFDYCSVV